MSSESCSDDKMIFLQFQRNLMKDWIWRKKLSRFCCSAFILFVLTMMPIRSTTEITELVMIVTPMTNLIKIDDDWWRWQYRWLSWLASISTLAPQRLLYCPDISLLRWSSATQFFSNQTKTNNTNNVVTHISQCPIQCSVVVCGMHWRISSVSMLIV